MDVGAYCLNAARMLAGEAMSVAAQQVVGPTGVDESFAAVMAFEDAVSAHFDCGFGIPDRSYLEVVGTQGTLQVTDPWHLKRSTNPRTSASRSPYPHFFWGECGTCSNLLNKRHIHDRWALHRGRYSAVRTRETPEMNEPLVQ